MEEWKKVVYKSTTLDNYMINSNGCVKNIKSNNICKSYEIK